MSEDPNTSRETIFDRRLSWFKNHRVAATVLVGGVIVIAIGTFTGALTNIITFIREIKAEDSEGPKDSREGQSNLSPGSNVTPPSRHSRRRSNVEQAMALIYTGQGSKAIQVLDSAIERLKDAPGKSLDLRDAYYYKALALYEDKRLDKALEAYDKALELDPSSLKAQVNRAKTIMYLGNLRQANQDLQSILEKHPNDFYAWNVFGSTLFLQGRYKNSADAFDHALRLDQKDDEVWLNKGRSLWYLKQYEASLAAFQKALLLYPDQPAQAFFDYGNVFYALKRYREAIKYYNLAAAKDPVNPQPWFNIGTTLLVRLNDPAAASSAFRHCTDLDSYQYMCWTNNGYALLKLKNPEDAFYSFKKALIYTKDDDAIDGALEALQLMRKMGDIQKGNALLQELSSTVPNDPKISAAMKKAGVNTPSK